jgi:cysteine synthase
MIKLAVNPDQRRKNARRCRERGIVLPTYAQMRDPALIPGEIRSALAGVGLWETHPLNLFRVNWHNQPVERGGGFGGVNFLEFPPELTGCPARILGIAGKWFPTGAHKVGPALSCLLAELVTGRFDPASQKAVWPSTGNYCRGGAFVSRLLACPAVAILPAGMSRERFEWLATMAEEVIATPGSESNVKEIFDKCRELERSRPEAIIFNQFDQLPNALWHYNVTGPALGEAFAAAARPGDRLAGAVAASGSAGTLSACAWVRDHYPGARAAVAEALQCPTILENGFGEHRIEGIGDKHVPWIHDLRATDLAVGVDDELPVRLLRLFNEPAGRARLIEEGVDPALVDRLDWLGISGIANLAAAIKFARHYSLGPTEVVVTVLTDSLALYHSRLEELRAAHGPYGQRQADRDLERLHCLAADQVLEMTEAERRRVHNLKYFTWVEQLGKDPAELRAQWDDPTWWDCLRSQAGALDRLIEEFNAEARP